MLLNICSVTEARYYLIQNQHMSYDLLLVKIPSMTTLLRIPP